MKPNYTAQVPQLVEAQPPQELPPSGAATPPSVTENEAKVDNTRGEHSRQWGQSASSPDRLNGRRSSNL